MRILMISRDTLHSSPGGDTIQIMSTAKYLRLLGVQVDVKLSSEEILYERYDIIHFFNIIRPDDILPHLNKSNLPFVVSTIFVDYSEYEKANRSGLPGLIAKYFNSDIVEYLKAIARMVKNGDKIKSFYYIFHGQRQSIKYIIKRAKILLPNSNNEYSRLKFKYNIEAKYIKVSNAIDSSIFNQSVEEDNNYKNHVICVARFEGLKNQLNLIKALSDSDLYLTLIGKPAPNHLDYFEHCKSLVSKYPKMQIIEHVDQNTLASIYKSAKVHVLPSWFETTGLSSLEAAVMNCNIVVSKKGDTAEYFGDLAWYCDPGDIQSIKEQVICAFNTEPNDSLRKKILIEYTWENAAQATLTAYNSVLNS